MSEEQKALAKVESWVARNSSWSFRAYRTASGLRLMATHETFDPEATQTARVLEELGCDPLFMRLCRTQKSFRARLTPKPWRIGVENPGFRFPYKATQAVAAANWRTQYEERSLEWAACAFIATIGRESLCEDARAIVAHHDQATKANSGQKLA